MTIVTTWFIDEIGIVKAVRITYLYYKNQKPCKE